MNISIDVTLRDLFPVLRLGCVESTVLVEPSNPVLTDEMNRVCKALQQALNPELIRTHPVVEMTKNAYRKLGQDPNRYRPAAESLLRRIALGKGLYIVNNMVDILNLVSIQTGFSIGGYDADCIEGDVVFGIGQPGEPYQGIGRGALNIANLPVFRDDLGPFGTSTSDSVRTMVTENTKRFLMVFPEFNPVDRVLDEALTLTVRLLEQFGNVKDARVEVVDCHD